MLNVLGTKWFHVKWKWQNIIGKIEYSVIRYLFKIKTEIIHIPLISY